MKTTKRPKRVHLDSKGKYYFIVNGKKKYIKVAHPLKKYAKNNLEQKQMVKIVINEDKYYKRLKRKPSQEAIRGKNVIFGRPIIKNMTALPVGFNFDQGKINELSHRINILSSSLTPLIENRNTHFPQVMRDTSRVLQLPTSTNTTTQTPYRNERQITFEPENVQQTRTTPARAQISSSTNTDTLRHVNTPMPMFGRRVTQSSTSTPATPAPSRAQRVNPENLYSVRQNRANTETPRNVRFVPNAEEFTSARRNLSNISTAPATPRRTTVTPEQLDSVQILNNAIRARRNRIQEDIPEEDEEEDNFMDGEGIDGKDGGLYDIEIQKIIADKSKRYVPVISCDQIMTLKKYIKPEGRFAFILNTDTSFGKGIHWTAVVIDFDDCSVNFYDSLANKPTKRTLDDIYKLITSFEPDCYFKLKVNSIKDQSDKSKNCGWFASYFVIQMLKGKSFADASLFSKTISKSEKQINKWKKSFL